MSDLDLVPWIALAVAAGVFVLLFARLVWSGAWSFRLAVGLAAVVLLALGWAVGPGLVREVGEAWRAVRGLEFVRPWWLLMFACVPTVFLMISNHFPTATYGNRYGLATMAVLIVAGWSAAAVLRRA